MSKRRYDFLNDKLVNKKQLGVINNKEKFNDKFKKYLNRDVSNINSFSFKQTEDVMIEAKKVIGRKNDESFLSSYTEYNLKDYRSPAFLAEDMKDNNGNCHCFLFKKKEV